MFEKRGSKADLVGKLTFKLLENAKVRVQSVYSCE